MNDKLELQHQQITRRHLLRTTIGCAGAVAAVGLAGTTPAAAEPATGEKWSVRAQRIVVKKSSREDAGFEATHAGRDCCSNCRNFIGPDRCAIVDVVCNENGLCHLHHKV
jgi:hypothetical protein